MEPSNWPTATRCFSTTSANAIQRLRPSDSESCSRSPEPLPASARSAAWVTSERSRSMCDSSPPRTVTCTAPSPPALFEKTCSIDWPHSRSACPRCVTDAVTFPRSPRSCSRSSIISSPPKSRATAPAGTPKPVSCRNVCLRNGDASAFTPCVCECVAASSIRPSSKHPAADP